MSRAYNKLKQLPAPAATEEEPEEQRKPEKIDLNDAAAIKHKLDSTAVEVCRPGVLLIVE